MIDNNNIVSEIRSFSRFYTNILGLLNQSILDSPYSLTEVRILLEINMTENCTANTLINKLNIDRGYLSRILNRFKSSEIIIKETCPKDGRLNFLKLTSKGKQILLQLEERSNNQARKLVSHLTKDEIKKLSESMAYIKSSLSFTEDDFKIRNYNSEDIEYIINLHKELYSHEYKFSSAFSDYVEKYVTLFHKSHDKNRENIWIAEINSKPVGLIAIVKESKDIAQLRWFLIEPDMRGKGLGHRLIKTALDFCEEKKYTHVFLWTADILKSARHIYKSYGFNLTESIDNTTWTDKLVKEERWDLDLSNRIY